MRAGMGKRKVKLAWIMNDKARRASLKKRKLGLVKKVNELTVLCDVKACLIIFSGDVAEPLVWSNKEVARGLLERYFALLDLERSKKGINQEIYLREIAGKAQEELVKCQKKNQEAEMDNIIFQINSGSRGLADLSTNESFALISYLRDKISQLRKRGELIRQQPLHNVPGMPNQPSGAAAGGQGSGVGANPMDDQNQYLLDQWIFNPSPTENVALPLAMAPPLPEQPVGMKMTPYLENPNYIHMGIPIAQYGSLLPGEGSSSSANPIVEMNLMSSHYPQEDLGGIPGLAPQPPNQSMKDLILNDTNPRHRTGMVPVGMGLTNPEGPTNPHTILKSQMEQFPSNFMGHDLSLMTHVEGEGSSSKTPIEWGLQPFGTDLRLQPHGFGGESNSAGGDLRLQPPGEGSSSAQQKEAIAGPSGSKKGPYQ